MSEERDGELGELRERARQTAQMLQEQSEELLKTAGRIEALTDGTPEWYPGMRTRVEAQEALRQVRVLLRALGDSDRSVRAGEGAKSRLPSTPRERMHAPFAATVDQSERRERVRNELEYVEDGVDPGEEQYRSSTTEERSSTNGA